MALNKTQAQFLSRIVPLAQKQAKEHGNKLFPSVTIAQAIHESGWGTSKRMVAANALFGVKVGSSATKFGSAWKGAAYKTGTTEYYDGKTATKITDYFRQYDTVEDSICDYMDMLLHCSRYRGAVSRNTPRQSIEGIIAGGYATGPNYVNSIMNIINLYSLTQYDHTEDSPFIADKICPYTEVTSTLKRGYRGDKVKCLQWYLNKNGANLVIDGAFGPSTEEAVKVYQKANNLSVDGIVGKNTWAMLKGA